MSKSIAATKVAQLRSTLETRALFDGLTEKFLLEKLLKDPRRQEPIPYTAVRDAILAQRSRSTKPPPLSRLRPSAELITDTVSPPEQATRLMKQAAVTSKEVDAYLTGVSLQDVPRSEYRERIHHGLLELISASSPNNLRTLMLFLSKYWQVGLFGLRTSIYEARVQARALLLRALEVHPQTTHEGGGEQVGVPDFHRFEKFVDNFFEYLEIDRRSGDELDSLLLQLSVKSGTLRATMSLVMGRPTLDERAMATFLAALSARRPSPKSLIEVRTLLLNTKTGPAAVSFLLKLCETRDDVLYVLEVVDASVHKRNSYAQCQGLMIKAVRRTAPLSVLFGVLQRIRSVVPVEPATLDEALEAAMEAKNVAGTHRLLEATQHDSPTVERAKTFVHTL